MRYYVSPPSRGWWTIAPQIPGAAAEDAPSRDESIARARTRAIEEAAAYARLGFPIELGQDDEIVDWTMPWWTIPDALMPTPPALLAAAVRRMDEVAAEVEAVLNETPPDAWDRDSGDGWTVRTTLDHVAGAFAIGLRRLEPWPLDPDLAQAEALTELIERVRVAPSEPVEHVGPNERPRRVRWTARKVVRVVRAIQDRWIAHLDGQGPRPMPPFADDDAEGDAEPPTEAELERLVEVDARLRRAASHDTKLRSMAGWYRYYRDRLTRWPLDERERWVAMRSAFQRRLLGLDERELALVRVAPSGECYTVRVQLGLGLNHVREHLEQMRALAKS